MKNITKKEKYRKEFDDFRNDNTRNIVSYYDILEAPWSPAKSEDYIYRNRCIMDYFKELKQQIELDLMKGEAIAESLSAFYNRRLQPREKAHYVYFVKTRVLEDRNLTKNDLAFFNAESREFLAYNAQLIETI